MATEEAAKDAISSEEPVKAAEAADEGSKRKKRKVALFLAYLGAGYSGMQHNEGVKTIESTLEAAITKADGISKDNAGDFYKIQWMRAARTDKGVSAVGQVVSLKMVISEPEDDGIVARINAELPPEIRVFGYRRVIGSFDARWSCDRRRYEYLIPAAAFDPRAYPVRSIQDGAGPIQTDEGTAAPSLSDSNAAAMNDKEPIHAVEAAAENGCGAHQHQMDATKGTLSPTPEDTGMAEASAKSQAEAAPQEPSLQAQGQPQQAEATDEHRSNEGPSAADKAAESSEFVFDEVQRAKLNEILKQYVGTHNFHNLATGVVASDNNAKRYIISFECKDVCMIQGEPWVRLVILGQSFMLNQIRKMIGLAVAIARGVAPPNAIGLALEPRRTVNTPVAPAVGLFLDESIYESYNEAWGRGREAALSLADFEAEVADFKEKLLYPSIARQDAAEESTARFIKGLMCAESQARLSGWADVPLAPPLKKPQRGGNGSAVIVGAQESYGVPGGKQGQGTKRRLAPWGRRGGRDAGKRPCHGRGGIAQEAGQNGSQGGQNGAEKARQNGPEEAGQSRAEGAKQIEAQASSEARVQMPASS